MRIILNSLFFLLIWVQIVKGQSVITAKKHGKSIINVSLYNGATFNSMNVHNDNVYPSAITVPSSIYSSLKVAIDFQRTTKSGFIYGGGLELGSMKQNFNYGYKSLDFVDTFNSLKDLSSKTEYRNHSPYIGLRLFVGYSMPVYLFKLKSTTLECKFQVGKQIVFRGAYLNKDLTVAYTSNDTIFVIPKNMNLFGYWGSGGGSLSGPFFTEINIGFRKEISQSFFNNIYVGFYGSLNFKIPEKETNGNYDINVTSGHYLNQQLQYFDHDRFTNRDFTLGLKVGLGLKI